MPSNTQTSTYLDSQLKIHSKNLLLRLCLVGLTKEHEIIASKKTVCRVSFDKVYSGDMQKLVKGKKKSKIYSKILVLKLNNIFYRGRSIELSGKSDRRNILL